MMISQALSRSLHSINCIICLFVILKYFIITIIINISCYPHSHVFRINVTVQTEPGRSPEAVFEHLQVIFSTDLNTDCCWTRYLQTTLWILVFTSNWNTTSGLELYEVKVNILFEENNCRTSKLVVSASYTSTSSGVIFKNTMFCPSLVKNPFFHFYSQHSTISRSPLNKLI